MNRYFRNRHEFRRYVERLRSAYGDNTAGLVVALTNVRKLYLSPAQRAYRDAESWATGVARK